MAGVCSCVNLAGHTLDLLVTAKGNKEEFRSLLVAVQSIYAFLKDLPEEGVTPQGTQSYVSCYESLCPDLTAPGSGVDLPCPKPPIWASGVIAGSCYRHGLTSAVVGA
jgi:hypothetical protein